MLAQRSSRLAWRARYDVFHDRKLIDGDRLSDDLCSMLRQTIIDRFDFDPGKDNVADAALQLCIEYSFDPIVEYLNGLRWDGIPRVEKIKAFVTRTHDRARGAYKRFRSDSPRRCVFIATTNENDYLKSQTGNRRFWPVRVGNIDMDRLRAERDQLWAEAAMIEKAGPPLILPEELWAAAVAEQNARVEVDPWDDLLTGVRGTVFRCDALTAASGQRFPPGDYEWLRSDDLMICNLGIPRERINNGAYKRLRPVMGRLGWNEGRHYFGGDNQRRGYFRQIR